MFVRSPLNLFLIFPLIIFEMITAVNSGVGKIQKFQGVFSIFKENSQEFQVPLRKCFNFHHFSRSSKTCRNTEYTIMLFHTAFNENLLASWSSIASHTVESETSLLASISTTFYKGWDYRVAWGNGVPHNVTELPP